MPVSKNNRLYYTKEQYARAKQNTNTLEYVRRQGYELVRCGQYYYMAEHDSLIFSPTGHWFWNSRGLEGRALEFIQVYEGRSFTEAVLILAGAMDGPRNVPDDPAPSNPAAQKVRPVEFSLPPRSKTQRHLFAYLCSARKIEKQVVEEMLRQNVLYQAVSVQPSGKCVYNACFVSHDAMGTPCSAFLRGISSPENTFKSEIPGGNKAWGWLLSGHNAKTLCVFEAAIDAASYITLKLQAGQTPWEGADYLALGGLTFTPIENYLTRHPHICSVRLLLDADQWGEAAVRRFREPIEALGCAVEREIPPHGKDWNDALRFQSAQTNTQK